MVRGALYPAEMRAALSVADGFLSAFRRRLLSATLWTVTLLLVAQHLYLLWQRLESQTLLEPLVAFRWLLALILLLALRALRQRGVPVLRGRAAVSFWLAVLLLHVHLAPVPHEALSVHQDGPLSPLTVPDALGAEPLLLLFALLAVFGAAVCCRDSASREGGSSPPCATADLSPASGPRAFPHLFSRPPPLVP